MLAKKEGLNYRANVAMVVFNNESKVLWCKRAQQKDKWQFPQGGVEAGESLTDAMVRELFEETSLKKQDVLLVKQSENWLYYQTPKPVKKKGVLYHGQKQKWFLLKLVSSIKLSDLIKLNKNLNLNPEFTDFKWLNFKDAKKEIVQFKQEIYQKIYQEFKNYL